MALVSTRLGFFTMAWVMAGIEAGSDGCRNFFFVVMSSSEKVCLASSNEPLVEGSWPKNGMMSTSLMIGGPAIALALPWAMTEVPCGIVAIRTTVGGCFGAVVAGTVAQMPGSRWMPASSVLSEIDCR